MSSKSSTNNIIELANKKSKSNKECNPNNVPKYQLNFNEIIATATFEYYNYNDTKYSKSPITVNKFQEVHYSADNNNIILSTNFISNGVDNSVVISEVPKYFYLFYSTMFAILLIFFIFLVLKYQKNIQSISLKIMNLKTSLTLKIQMRKIILMWNNK